MRHCVLLELCVVSTFLDIEMLCVNIAISTKKNLPIDSCLLITTKKKNQMICVN